MHLALRFVVAAMMFASAACSCGGGGVGSASAGFRTQTDEVDFGKALEGTEITRTVELVATGRAEITIDVSVEGPFRAPSSVTLPGGGSEQLEVTFIAPEGDATGTLILSARDESFEVELRGRGVRPLSCMPTAACRTSTFVLETEQCEETTDPDGAACSPEGVCLDDGVCRAGECVGTPRTCDDGNACTQDACSVDVGCVHVDVSSQCPAPANPCEVATCSPVSGCGVAVREDAALCGTIDCVTAHLCQEGECKALPTPENFVCAPQTPCQGEGRCSMGECVRPDAGVLTAAWTLPLGASPAGAPSSTRLLGHGGNLFFATCGLADQDGGCAVASYTGNGFQRFAQPLPDGEPLLHAVSGRHLWVQQDGGLFAYVTSGGTQAWSLPLVDAVPAAFVDPGGGTRVQLPAAGLAADWDGGVMLALSVLPGGSGDGGVVTGVDGGMDTDGGAPALVVARLAEDGGVSSTEVVQGADVDSALALGSPAVAWLHGAGGAVVTTLAEDADAGSAWRTIAYVPVPGPFSVGEEGRFAFPGGVAVVAADGGIVPLLTPVDGGFGEGTVGFETLSTDGIGYVFFRACRPPLPSPCSDDQRALLVRAFSLSDRTTLWEGTVLPPSFEGRLVDAALTSGALSGGLAVLSEVQLPTEQRTDVQLFFNGNRAMMCPLPGEPHVAGSTMNGSFLYVLVDREGVRRLEAYDLAPLSFTEEGWPVPGGIGGTRRTR